jgi:hypothetical protein
MSKPALSEISTPELEAYWQRDIGSSIHVANVHIDHSLNCMEQLEKAGHYRPMALIRGPAIPTNSMLVDELKSAGLVGGYVQAP